MHPEGVLLDLSGTLHVGDTPLPGATDAVARLRAAGIGIRALSNTSRMTRAQLAEAVQRMGLDLAEGEILTAPLAARRWIEEHGLRPHLLVHPDLLAEFDGLDTRQPDAVLVADAGEGFSYENLNTAFRLLMDGAVLIATGANRYFQDGDVLSLDAGPFVHALEFAAGVRAEVIGKPAPAFFQAAVDDIGCTADACAMIGDDAGNDVAAAMGAGLRGMLVRTGKYRAGDEAHCPGAPCADDVAAAVRLLLD